MQCHQLAVLQVPFCLIILLAPHRMHSCSHFPKVTSVFLSSWVRLILKPFCRVQHFYSKVGMSTPPIVSLYKREGLSLHLYPSQAHGKRMLCRNLQKQVWACQAKSTNPNRCQACCLHELSSHITTGCYWKAVSLLLLL